MPVVSTALPETMESAYSAGSVRRVSRPNEGYQMEDAASPYVFQVRQGLVPGATEIRSIGPDGVKTVSRTQRFGGHVVTSEKVRHPSTSRVYVRGTPGTITTHGTSCRPPRTYNAVPAAVPVRSPIRSRNLYPGSSTPGGQSRPRSTWNPGSSTPGGQSGQRIQSTSSLGRDHSAPNIRKESATVVSERVQYIRSGGHIKQKTTRKEVFTPAPPLPISAVGKPGEPFEYGAPDWLVLTSDGLKVLPPPPYLEIRRPDRSPSSNRGLNEDQEISSIVRSDSTSSW